MTTLTGVPRTLLLTLRARADEHERPDGLFQDTRAAEWIDMLPWSEDFDALYDAKLQNSFAIRTRIFDDAAERFLQEHPYGLVVELGAGLSTRRDRIGRGRGHWIELDLPEVIALRRMLEQEEDGHLFMARSLFHFGWMDDLPDANPQEMLFIAEGVMVFVEKEDVRALVDEMRTRFPGATFLLDVGGGALETKSSPRFMQVGAQMKWFVQGEEEVESLGLRLINVWPLLAQYPERWGGLSANPLPPNLRISGLMIEAQILPLP